MNAFPQPGALAPSHHPDAELLLDYAAGAASPAEALMIAAHLALCPECRTDLRLADAVGGALLDTLGPARLPPNMLNRALAAIDAGSDDPKPIASDRLSDIIELPADAPWRTLPGGFRMRRVPCEDKNGRVWLFDAPAGMRLMPHRHVGDEWTVILSGEFIDDDNCYRAGDFGALADDREHRPHVGAGERCVSLIMVRENPRYTTLLGKLLAPFVPL